jgi:hypothetical protein
VPAVFDWSGLAKAQSMDRPQHAVRDLERQTRLETTCLAVIVSSFGSRAERVTMPVIYTGYVQRRTIQQHQSPDGHGPRARGRCGPRHLCGDGWRYAQDPELQRLRSHSVPYHDRLYLFSTLYHALVGPAKRVFQVLDHQAIYLLIAGTYTPFPLVALEGTLGWRMFGAIWGLAVFGILLDAIPRKGPRVVPIIIYILMGWLCLFALDTLLASLPPEGFRWLLVGGIFYTSRYPVLRPRPPVPLVPWRLASVRAGRQR